jgi:hypothetical protein
MEDGKAQSVVMEMSPFVPAQPPFSISLVAEREEVLADICEWNVLSVSIIK